MPDRLTGRSLGILVIFAIAVIEAQSAVRETGSTGA